MWTLRAEIEAAIARRIKECEAAGVPLYIEDIKRFYNLKGATENTAQADNVIPLKQNDADADVTSLMESLGAEEQSEANPENPNPESPEAAKPEEKLEGQGENGQSPTTNPDGTPINAEENKNMNTAEAIIAKQTEAGLENKKPNPILERPYTRAAPDSDQISYGFAFLADMNMDQLLTFTKEKYLQGQSIVIEFLIPQGFKMSADVATCNHYAMRSRIISDTKPDYRVQCRFTFAISGERDSLRNFLKSIEPTIMHERRKKKVSEEDSLGI